MHFCYAFIFAYDIIIKLGVSMKIAITAESTIDLPIELLNKYDIKTVPFTVLLGEKLYKDGEISPTDIFKFVDENKVLPKTSAVNREQYIEFFNNTLKDYDAIVHISLSSEISSAYSNAKAVADEMNNVYVIDSRTLSTGIALLAIQARKFANDGFNAEEVYNKTKEKINKIQASFVIKKLNYLYKGGRCSALSYYSAKALQIRPEIIVKDGVMKVNKRHFGKMDKVIASYCKSKLEECPNPDLDVAFITFPSASENMINVAKQALQTAGFKNIYTTNAGATITSHCGEDTLGILFMNN